MVSWFPENVTIGAAPGICCTPGVCSDWRSIAAGETVWGASAGLDWVLVSVPQDRTEVTATITGIKTTWLGGDITGCNREWFSNAKVSRSREALPPSTARSLVHRISGVKRKDFQAKVLQNRPILVMQLSITLPAQGMTDHVGGPETGSATTT